MQTVQAILSAVSALALALWVGAMFATAALFTPLLFAMADSRERAGRIAGATIARVESLGAVAGGILLMAGAIQFGNAVTLQAGVAMAAARLAVYLGMLALSLINATTVRPKLHEVREQMQGPLDDLAADDPLRLAYRRHHRTSVLVFGGALALGLLAVVLAALP